MCRNAQAIERGMKNNRRIHSLPVSFLRYCSYRPDDGPVYGVIMHPREYFDNVTMRVTKMFKVCREQILSGGGSSRKRLATYEPREIEVVERARMSTQRVLER